VEIAVWPEADVPTVLRRQVVELRDAAWPPDLPGSLAPSHDPLLRPVSLLLVEGDEVVAALDILSKELPHGGVTYAASGLATVVTRADLRRRGHGLRLIRAARETMGAAGADLAVFTCDAVLAPFYEAGGYAVLPGATLVGGTPDAPLRSDELDKVVLWRPYTAKADVRAGDFAGAEIELYPGPIDRLW